MAAPKLPPAPQTQESMYFVEMLEPQSDSDIGRKLKIGDVIRVPESKARRLVEHTGIGKLVTERAYNNHVEKKRVAAEEARARAAQPQFGAHIANANALNANFAALSRDPDAFDASGLPRQDASARSLAERRGLAERQGQRSVGDATLEQQLASLDALEVAKGNAPLSAGMQGTEFMHGEQSATSIEQTGVAGVSGRAAPSFEDLGDDPDELDDDEEEDTTTSSSKAIGKPKKK